MTAISLALESLSYPINKQAVSHKFLVDEKLHKLDNYFSLVTECYRVTGDIKNLEFISFSDYSDIKDWVYTKSAQFSIPVKMNMAIETISSCQTLALEGMHNFFKSIWETIENTIFKIWELIKKALSNTIEKLDNISKKFSILKNKFEVLVCKKEYFDDNEVKAYVNTSDLKGELTVFRNMVLNDIPVEEYSINGINNHIGIMSMQVGSVLNALDVLMDIGTLKNSYTKNLCSSMVNKELNISAEKILDSNEFSVHQTHVVQQSLTMLSKLKRGLYTDKQSEIKRVSSKLNPSIVVNDASFLIFKSYNQTACMHIFAAHTSIPSLDINKDVYKLSCLVDNDADEIKLFTLGYNGVIPVPGVEDASYAITGLINSISKTKDQLSILQNKFNNNLQDNGVNINAIKTCIMSIEDVSNNIILSENMQIIKSLVLNGISDALVIDTITSFTDSYYGASQVYFEIINAAYTENLK